MPMQHFSSCLKGFLPSVLSLVSEMHAQLDIDDCASQKNFTCTLRVACGLTHNLTQIQDS